MRAASPSIDGWLTWGRVAVGGARVELHPSTYTGAGALVSAAITRADGYFALTGYDNAIDMEVDVAAQLGYLAASRPTFRAAPDACGIAHLGDAPNSFNVQKPITGLSMPACASFDCQESNVRPSAPFAVRWDALPNATVYCVSVLNNDTGSWALAGGDCPLDPSGGDKSVGTGTSYTVPALPPARYQFSVFSKSGDVLNPTGWVTAYFTVR